MTTNTQHRATCSACFAQQAITSRGLLVSHGYTRPQHWHSNVGTCTGAGHAHFGTEAGRDYTRSLAARLRVGAMLAADDALAVEAGTAPVLRRERQRNSRVYMMVTMTNPTERDRAQYAAALRAQRDAMVAQAQELDALVAAWKPAEPIAVQVEVKQPLMHWRSTHPRFNTGRKACAASLMASHAGYMTSEIKHVTCAKCIERHARWTAQQ